MIMTVKRKADRKTFFFSVHALVYDMPDCLRSVAFAISENAAGKEKAMVQLTTRLLKKCTNKLSAQVIAEAIL